MLMDDSPRDVVRIVQQLFGEALGLSDLREWNLEDDFFDLGGDSLAALRLVNLIRDVFEVEMPLRNLFKNPTVYGVVGSLGMAARVRVPLKSQELSVQSPTSFGQHRLWVINKFDPVGGLYNVPIAIRIQGQLDNRSLELALNDVVEQQEILRTLLVEIDGVPWQRVVKPNETLVQLQQETVSPGDLAKRLERSANHAFDLEGEIPIAAWLFRIVPEEHVLLIVIHHVAFDDGSVRPFFEGLSHAYVKRCQRDRPAHAPPPVRYSDYALWQREFLGSETESSSVYCNQIRYWKSVLSGAPNELSFPSVKPRPARPSFAGGRMPIDIDADLHCALRKLARSTRTSIFMLAHTALAAALVRLGAGPDVVLGAPVAGRSTASLDNVVGFFVNTLVLRVDCSGNIDLATLLARVRDADLEAFDNQDVPFDRVVEAINPERNLARHPLFQVMLTILKEGGGLLKAPGLQCVEEPINSVLCRYDLWLGLMETQLPNGDCAGLQGEVRFSTDLFDSTLICELIGQTIGALLQLVETPTISLLSAPSPSATRRQKLVTLNTTRSPSDPVSI
jgi:acyl carrier protein